MSADQPFPAPAYHILQEHYETCFRQHGDTHRGVDWPEAAAAQRRYDVMLDVMPDSATPSSLLDVGCGLGHLYERVLQRGMTGLAYHGLDISPRFVEACRTKFPAIPFHRIDLLDPSNDSGREALGTFDFVVMNGVFTEKLSLTQEEMKAFFQALLARSFAMCRKGLAFNVMSKQVDWERADLFHLSFDEMASIVVGNLTRNFVIRQDYGLYEYTVYLYR